LRKFKKTRDPEVQLRRILEQKHPIKSLVALAVQHALSEPMAHQSPVKHAAWLRDQFLLHLQYNIPLRVGTLAGATYKPGNDGNLYQRTDDNSWWFWFPSSAFKNEDGAANGKDYRVPLPESMWPLVKRYTEEARPLLLETYGDQRQGFEHDLFLVNADLNAYRKHGVPDSLRRKAKSLSDRVRNLSKTYLGVSIGGHGPRHIVATDWLTNNPDNVMTIAAVLHDKPETIIKNYAHLVPANFVTKFQAYVEKIAA
jgi:integrase